MSRKRRARSKAQKTLGQESVNENNTNLETSSNKQSPSDVKTTVGTLMQTDSTDLSLFPEHQYRDNVSTTATVSCQIALFEVESAAKLPSTNPMELDLNPIENHLENNVAGKKKRKKKKKNKNNCSAAMTDPQVTLPNAESTVQLPAPEPLQVTFPSAESSVQLPAQVLQALDMNLANNLEVKSVNRKRKKRKKKNLNNTSNVLDEDSTAKLLASKHQEGDTNLTGIVEKSESGQKSAQVTLPNAESTVQLPAPEPLQVTFPSAESSAQLPAQVLQALDMNLANNLEVKSVNRKRKKRKKKNLNNTSNVLDEDSTAKLLASKHQEGDTNLTEIEEKSESGQKSANGKKKRRKKKNLNKPTSNVIDVESTAEVLVPEHQERDTSSPIDLEEKTANGRKRKRGENIVKPPSDDKHVELTAQLLPPDNQEKKKKKKRRKVKKAANNKIDNVKTETQNSLSSEREETEALCAGFVKLCPEDVNIVSVQTEHTPTLSSEREETEALYAGFVKLCPEDVNIVSVQTEHTPTLSSEREETEALFAGFVKLCPEDVNIVSVQTEHTPNVKATTINCENFENGSYLTFPEKNSVESCSQGTHLPSNAEVTMHVGTHSRRKLLILDLNGLLADIVKPPPKGIEADARLLGRAVFKRPFCDDFLKFCFERFDVGIWSSRTKKVIDRVVDYLLGDLKHKLLFCWDMSHSTKTKFKTRENWHKPLVCKDLRKLWGKQYRNLPWKKGDYDESNTLLLDDSPYKALLNPVHTTLFPYSYNFKLKNDNSLGPGGDLRVYLEKLADAEHVQKYVEEHPFGQSPITEKSPHWDFYSKVINSIHDQANRGKSV